MKKEKIYIGADHAGFALKQALIPFLKEMGFDVEDKGPFTLDPADDYPDFILPVAEAVAHSTEARGIVIGASGQGEAIAANRFKGVRAIVFYGAQGNAASDIITLSREHNDANILSLGARFISVEEAKTAVKLWLNTTFSNDPRHIRRLKKLEA